VDLHLKALAIICARGGSKELPGKNILLLNGKPLIAHTIEQVLSSKYFEKVIVSTDSKKIRDISKDFGAAVPFLRPKHLAGDRISKIPSIRHALLECEKLYGEVYELIADFDPTSPLRNNFDIKESISLMKKSKASNLISGTLARRSPYFNLIEKYSDSQIGLSKPINPPVTCRQDSPVCYDMNASIYIWKRDILLNHDSLFFPDTIFYEMPAIRSFDIDREIDFVIVESLAKKYNLLNDYN